MAPRSTRSRAAGTGVTPSGPNRLDWPAGCVQMTIGPFFHVRGASVVTGTAPGLPVRRS